MGEGETERRKKKENRVDGVRSLKERDRYFVAAYRRDLLLCPATSSFHFIFTHATKAGGSSLRPEKVQTSRITYSTENSISIPIELRADGEQLHTRF